MQFGRIWTMRGPSIWSRTPVIEAEVEIGPDDAVPAARLAALGLAPPTNLAEALLQTVRLFQKRLGHEGPVGLVHETRKPGFHRVVFDYDDESLANACLQKAFEFLTTPSFDVPAALAALRDLAHEIRLGPSTRGIVAAALARGIPVRRLTSGSLVQLGWASKLRRIWTAETDKTPLLAETIAQDKELTRTLLYEVGVPIPWGRAVTSADDAWAAAEELGLPVVVKPQFGNQGRGVATDLSTREQVVAAYEAARQQSSFIMVENHLLGQDHRLLVVGGKLVAASLREPAHVVGDGKSTIAELVAVVNQDPRRSDGHATPLSFIKIDAIARGVLVEQGYGPDSVPPAGARVLIRRNANLSTGGTATDVTDRVHPENAEIAIDAARAVGLDIAGVDFVAEDISRPVREQGGGVVEVNAGPGLRMHLEPSAGLPRDVGSAIVDSLFAPGDDGRIPTVAVTGVNGKTTTTRLIAHLLRTAGKSVGMTCTDGIYLNGRRTETRDCSGPQSARAIFLNPRVEVAVLETARGGILREGLGFDRCSVGVVTNLGKGDHFGLRGIETLEELARVKRVVIENVADDGWGVLNAADPYTAAMASFRPGKVLLFARSEEEPALARHRAAGGTALFVRGSSLVLSHAGHEENLLTLEEIPFLHHGIPFQVENALAGTGAAWCLGLSLDLLRAGLRTFHCSAEECPARFNVLSAGAATVIVDYAHNPSALESVIEGLDVFALPRRTLVTSGSNRRDSELIEMGEMMARAFDRVILYADWGHSGRADGELNAFLKQGLARGGRVRDIQEVPSERAAIDLALERLEPGELLVLGIEAIDDSLAYVRSRLQMHPDASSDH